MALEGAAKEYFSSLNPLASRISSDLQKTKDSYEHLWHKLPEPEKNEILNDTIIKPEVLVKYKQENVQLEENFAAKIVVDDHCSYRDEHSGPFSFRTQSQRDLYALFQKQYAQQFLKTEKMETKPKQVQSDKITRNPKLEDRKFSITLDDENIILELTSSLPKTGLDFLDDW